MRENETVRDCVVIEGADKENEKEKGGRKCERTSRRQTERMRQRERE